MQQLDLSDGFKNCEGLSQQHEPDRSGAGQNAKSVQKPDASTHKFSSRYHAEGAEAVQVKLSQQAGQEQCAESECSSDEVPFDASVVMQVLAQHHSPSSARSIMALLARHSGEVAESPHLTALIGLLAQHASLT